MVAKYIETACRAYNNERQAEWDQVFAKYYDPTNENGEQPPKAVTPEQFAKDNSVFVRRFQLGGATAVEAGRAVALRDGVYGYWPVDGMWAKFVRDVLAEVRDPNRWTWRTDNRDGSLPSADADADPLPTPFSRYYGAAASSWAKTGAELLYQAADEYRRQLLRAAELFEATPDGDPVDPAAAQFYRQLTLRAVELERQLVGILDAVDAGPHGAKKAQ